VSVATKRGLAQAEKAAQFLVSALSPYLAEAEVAGSRGRTGSRLQTTDRRMDGGD